MKKIIYGVVVTLTAFSLMACSGDKKSDSKETTTKEVETEEFNEFGFSMDTSDDENYKVVEDEDVKGKKFSELIAAGYKYTGYVCGGMDDEKECVISVTKADGENEEEMLANYEGMTVEEFANDDFTDSISYISVDGGSYTFSSYIGGVNFTFEIEDADEIMKKYEDEVFLDIEYVEEFADKKISGIELKEIEYSVLLDESAVDIVSSEDFSEEMLSDCIVEKCYYKTAK